MEGRRRDDLRSGVETTRHDGSLVLRTTHTTRTPTWRRSLSDLKSTRLYCKSRHQGFGTSRSHTSRPYVGTFSTKVFRGVRGLSLCLSVWGGRLNDEIGPFHPGSFTLQSSTAGVFVVCFVCQAVGADLSRTRVTYESSSGCRRVGQRGRYAPSHLESHVLYPPTVMGRSYLTVIDGVPSRVMTRLRQHYGGVRWKQF